VASRRGQGKTSTVARAAILSAPWPTCPRWSRNAQSPASSSWPRHCTCSPCHPLDQRIGLIVA